MSLRGDESRHTAFSHEFRDVRPFDLPLHDGQSGDHLIVGLGHVARPGGQGDFGVVQFGRVLVHVRHLEPRLLERLEGQSGSDGLRGRTRAVCLPKESSRMTGVCPSSGVISSAKLPMQFSRAFTFFFT